MDYSFHRSLTLKIGNVSLVYALVLLLLFYHYPLILAMSNDCLDPTVQSSLWRVSANDLPVLRRVHSFIMSSRFRLVFGASTISWSMTDLLRKFHSPVGGLLPRSSHQCFLLYALLSHWPPSGSKSKYEMLLAKCSFRFCNIGKLALEI